MKMGAKRMFYNMCFRQKGSDLCKCFVKLYYLI